MKVKLYGEVTVENCQIQYLDNIKICNNCLEMLIIVEGVKGKSKYCG